MDCGVPCWKQALHRLITKVRSLIVIIPASEVVVLEARELDLSGGPGSRPRLDAYRRRTISKAHKRGTCISANGKMYLVKAKQDKGRDPVTNCRWKAAKLRKKDAKKLLESVVKEPCRYVANGGSDSASLFTKRGLKGINQDAMLVLENFAARSDTVFCGVFDGHGPDGHLIARSVRDLLPEKLAGCWQALQVTPSSEEGLFCRRDAGLPSKNVGVSDLITTWKESFLKAYKLMDRELLVDEKLDCLSSGTTAVTLVKQGSHLFIGSVGDSRAVLGMSAEDNSLMALQLTVDLKPNLPKEAERIRRLKGRVFALRNEPLVKRVWLPHRDAPGLAMARALGDYCLKNFGVISEPIITYRQLTDKDKFIVLATDGVWDVLTNDQVTKIVASVQEKSLAAKAVVDAAMYVWRSRYSTSKVDDCAVVCLFLTECTVSNDSSFVEGESLSFFPRPM